MPAVLFLLLTAAGADRVIVIEDWTRESVSLRGIPSGWTGESFGRRADYDFAIEQSGDGRALHLKSQNDHSTIARDITGKVHLQETPILEWTWKATILPAGGDLRRKETTDMAAQLYIVWPRFPALLRSRIIGYVWDAATPAATIVKSQKTGTVTFVVMRSGSKELGKWLTERRNVVEDYRHIFGEYPDDPSAITISIDSNDTRSTAEAFIGPIVFRAR
ncbi:MAG TPA: DUF3047 domain-containing protein [Terriglobales bacterium]|nr:DUF3047 domain-containing protein [Terriglobales bacterium]